MLKFYKERVLESEDSSSDSEEEIKTYSDKLMSAKKEDYSAAKRFFEDKLTTMMSQTNDSKVSNTSKRIVKGIIKKGLNMINTEKDNEISMEPGAIKHSKTTVRRGTIKKN
jgi:hypothetical protein